MKKEYKREVDAVLLDVDVASDISLHNDNGDIVKSYDNAHSIRFKMSDEFNVIMSFGGNNKATLVEVIHSLENCIDSLKYRLSNEEINRQARKEGIAKDKEIERIKRKLEL